MKPWAVAILTGQLLVFAVAARVYIVTGAWDWLVVAGGAFVAAMACAAAYAWANKPLRHWDED